MGGHLKPPHRFHDATTLLGVVFIAFDEFVDVLQVGGGRYLRDLLLRNIR